MWSVFITIHIILCIFMVLVILLQSGKGSDLGAAFGGSSQTVFGPSGGATFLSKMTTFIAVGFLVTSLVLAYHSARRIQSTIVKDDAKVEQPADTGMKDVSEDAKKDAKPSEDSKKVERSKPAETEKGITSPEKKEEKQPEK